jgi:hypothetical protein
MPKGAGQGLLGEILPGEGETGTGVGTGPAAIVAAGDAPRTVIRSTTTRKLQSAAIHTRQEPMG